MSLGFDLIFWVVRISLGLREIFESSVMSNEVCEV